MSVLKRFTNLFRTEKLSDDISRELSFHIRERAEELMERGMPEQSAIEEARRQFGNPTFQAEAARDHDIIGWIDSVFADVRYATRALLRSPVFATVAIASLALGIGANTAIYTLIDAVLVRSLPVPNPQELAQVTTSDADDDGYFTNPLWEEVRNRQSAFVSIAAVGETGWNIAEGGEVRRVHGAYAGGDYFALFGMRPALGRLFTRGDDVRGCAASAVLGNGFWRSEYGGRSDVIGRTISLQGKPFEIVGVAAEGFAGPEVGREIQVYAPLCSEAVIAGETSALDRRSNWWLRVIGRRDPSVSLEQARARLKGIAPEAYAATVPQHWGADNKADYAKRTFSAIGVSQGMSSLRTRYGTALKVLMGAVALVLLIACANVANLLLARAAARQREVAIRMAIGAGRRRVVRQLLTESALLAAAGAVGGSFVAYWGTRGLVALISTAQSPVWLDLSVNLRILGFTVLAATITAVLFGLVPAWRGTRVEPQSAMRAHGRGIAEGRFRIGKALVVAQVALSLTLLVGAGLLIGSLYRLKSVDLGFRAQGVLLAQVNFGRTGLPKEQMANVQRGLLERVRATPGVRAAASADLTPIGGSSWNDQIYVDGYTPKSAQDHLVWFNAVSDGYFAALDLPLLAGRDFGAGDVKSAPRVGVVDQATAEKFFGGDAIGKQFTVKRGDTFEPAVTIVGVVRNAKYQRLRETNSMTVYLASSQQDVGSYVNLAVRGDGDTRALVAPLKGAVAEVHRQATIEVRTLEEQVATSLSRDRVLALLSGLFGAVALLLSMLGLYGVMAYTVARRKNEIGVRIALGAASTRVVRMVLGDVARVVAIGALVGIAGALAAGKLVASFLYGLEARDPLVLAAATGVLVSVALVAGLIPALRASRVDPVAALRED
jgi:putative ABC transport system permease protein